MKTVPSITSTDEATGSAVGTGAAPLDGKLLTAAAGAATGGEGLRPAGSAFDQPPAAGLAETAVTSRSSSRWAAGRDIVTGARAGWAADDDDPRRCRMPMIKKTNDTRLTPMEA